MLGPYLYDCQGLSTFRNGGRAMKHLVRDQGVGGSNPLSPTIYLNPIFELADFLFPSLPELGTLWDS